MEQMIYEKTAAELEEIARDIHRVSDTLEWNVSGRENIAARLDEAEALAKELARELVKPYIGL